MRFESWVRRLRPAAALAVTITVTLGCSDDREPAAGRSDARTPTQAAAPAAAPEPVDLVAQGRGVYMGSCIACHNPDPKVDGALGPAVAGASEALIEARVMRAEYPAGYTPKRDTKQMIAMPFLKDKIPALAAYLASEG